MEELDIFTAAESEAFVLGSILQHGTDAYDQVSSIVRASDFADPVNATLFNVLQAKVMEGEPTDVPALIDYFGARPGVNWDMNYTIKLSQEYYPARSAAWHAKQVADRARERKAREIMQTGIHDMQDKEKTLQQRIGGVVAALEDVVAERTETEPVLIRDMAANLIDEVMAVSEGKKVPGRSTHIPGLDKKLAGGTRDGKLIIVAARPSVGKSSFAMQMLISQAQDGVPGAFFGMEMENDEVTMRAVANLGYVSFANMMSGRMDEDDWSKMSEGVERVMHLPIHLFDKSGMTLAEVVSHARKLVRKHKIKNLVIDYLQLMKGTDDKKERRMQLEEITRSLKRLAKELGLTVWLLSQLNRDVEKRTNPRPQMSDLKECGAIEEDADVIMFLWEHKSYDDENHLRGLLVGKCRGGQKGEVALHFHGPTQRWAESTESLASDKPKGKRSGFED